MRNRIKTTLITAISLIVILVFLNLSGTLKPARSIADIIIFNPIRHASSNLAKGMSNFFATFVSISSLGEKNSELESELTDLKSKLSELKEIKNENEILRAQLNFESKVPVKTSPARVTSYEPDNVRKFLTIDKGSRNGLSKGMPVISGGVLVGTLDQVDSFSSKVFLVNDPEFRIRAIGQDKRASGIVKGQIGQGLMLEKVAQNDSISIGEYVITAGSEDVPKGILIGQIDGISKSDNSIFQTANLKTLINFNKLELVFVVVK